MPELMINHGKIKNCTNVFENLGEKTTIREKTIEFSIAKWPIADKQKQSTALDYTRTSSSS